MQLIKFGNQASILVFPWKHVCVNNRTIIIPQENEETEFAITEPEVAIPMEKSGKIGMSPLCMCVHVLS